MAYRKRYTTKKRSYRRPVRRSSFRRRRPIRSNTRRITRMTVRPMVMADKTFVKLTRNFPITISIANTADLVVAELAGNGFLDAINTNAPAGLSQWVNFYKCYRIFASAIKVVSYPSTNAITPGTLFGVTPTMSGDDQFTSDSAPSQPYAKWKVGSSVNPVVIKHVMSAKKIFGQRITTEDDYQGTMSYDPVGNEVAVEDPAKEFVWRLWASRATTAGALPLTFYVTITYYVQLEDRKIAKDSSVVAPE